VIFDRPERKGHGAKVPGSEMARERKGQGASRPGIESARVLLADSLRGAKGLGTFIGGQTSTFKLKT